MKYANHKLFLGVASIILAAWWSNNIFSVMFMSLGCMQISSLIDDTHLKRKTGIIFALLVIISGILYFIGKWNYGNHFDLTFKNIF
jgi:predicted membrane channel-forming protein YqfA (hemolysin III family)